MPTKPQAAKAKKPQVKVRDMKPKKNAKGGGSPAGSMGWDVKANTKA